MEMNKKAQEKQALKLLNTEVTVKYPKGSFIVFDSSYNKAEGLKPLLAHGTIWWEGILVKLKTS